MSQTVSVFSNQINIDCIHYAINFLQYIPHQEFLPTTAPPRPFLPDDAFPVEAFSYTRIKKILTEVFLKFISYIA